jgi:hypothetical protein
MREGYYSDKYFVRAREVILADHHRPRVLMQVFGKSQGYLGGIDEAIAILKLSSESWNELVVEALYDGEEIKPWETVLTINQSLCQAQKTTHQPKAKSFEAARRLWEQSIPKAMSLAEVLDVCRQCQDIGPFVFNNGNTFASISKTLVQDWLQALPAVEGQILRTTVSHYVAGQVGKKELLQVLRHVETRWQTAAATQTLQRPLENPQAEPSAS